MPALRPLADYVASLRLRYIADGTISTYSKHLRRYFDFIGDRDGPRDELIREFLEGLTCRGTTKRAYWQSISAFHSWHGDRLEIHPRFQPARKTPPPEQAEIARRLRLLPSDTWVRRRDRTCLILLYLTGARLGEISGLKWEHVGAASISIYMPKVSQWRDAPLTPLTRAVLDAWRPESHPVWVFPSLTNGYRTKRVLPKPMCYVHAARFWRSHQKDLGEKPIPVHKLRHAFSSHSHANAALSESEIQRQLGHSTDVMTKWYISTDSTVIDKKISGWHDQLDLI